MKTVNTWKRLEEAIMEQGRERMKHYGVFIHRLYDTRSASVYLPPQPSDFIVLPHQGRTTFLEAKFSESHESLRSCFSSSVDGQQLAAARLIERAKRDYRVLFFSKVSQTAELWHGGYLAECRSAGLRLDLTKRLVVSNNLTELLDVHILKLRKFQ